jgi:succinate dehydrogenase/fumarate reductase cytochrome b subunit
MILKTAIVIVLIAMVISLITGFNFLVKDLGDPTKKRTAYALGVRVGLAILLLILIAYGLWSGQLGINAPWLN